MMQNETTGRRAGPTRMCVICRGRYPKSALRRHVAAATGDARLVPDPRAVMPGRGHYLCANPECAEKFSKYSGRPRRRRGGNGE
ncbi:YlxR family protein [Desulfovibrio sp. JY]|uniref:YlxR family protein n=1 Tax=Solidesulfovibrio sp. C21 TaxID=3398613 RepID=UPI0039FBFB44|nr:YlxR family protein [Desulfovibrio sp. JY]